MQYTCCPRRALLPALLLIHRPCPPAFSCPSLLARALAPQRLLKLARRAFGGSLNRAWNQWVDVVEHKARLRTLMGRGLNGAVMRAFNSLADHAS